MSNVKESPKGCGCKSCTRGRHTKSGQFTRMCANRAVRRVSKIVLKKLTDLDALDIPPNRMGLTD